MLEKEGKKYYKVFDLRTLNPDIDPDGMVTEEFLLRASQNYDPINIHEAPFWAEHPRYYSSEPRTGGYIDSVIAIGSELYVSFSEILPWMKELYETREMKRCSVELCILKIGDKRLEYFYGMCPTNAPASRGLPPLIEQHQFSDKTEHKFADKAMIEKIIVCADFEIEKIIFTNNKIQTMQNKQLADLAKNMGIAVTDSMSDDQLQDAVNKKYSETQAAAKAAAEQVANEKKSKANELVQAAITSGTLKPAEGESEEAFGKRKAAIVAFAEADFEGAKAMLNVQASDNGSILKNSGLDKSTVKTGASTGVNNDDLKNVTFNDILEKPEQYMGRFTDEQLEELHKKDPRWKNAGIIEKQPQ